MANSLLTTKTIARELLPILKENLVFPMLVNQDYSKEYENVKQRGSVVRIEKPAVFVADEFGGTINLQDIGEKEVPVTLDKIADVSIAISAADLALTVKDFRTKYLESAATAIAEKINQDGLALYKEVPYNYGTSGTTPSALSDFTNARKVLNINKVPMMDRKTVWDPSAEAKFLELDAIVGADKSGSTAALRAGSIGDIMGFENFMTQAVKTHTAGGYTSLADVTAAVTAANNANDSTSGFDYSAVIFTSTAGAAVTKLLKGDLINMVDDDANAYQVTVLEDTAAAIAGVVTAKVFPALTADATDTAVTFNDVTARAHVANLAFHPKAFAFVNRRLDQPRSVEAYVVNYEGLSMRVVEDYNSTTKVTTLSMDILYGFKTVYPQLATRVLG